MVLQIVVPVYNEANNIAETINQIAEKVRTSHSILIIYDFDGDNTLPVVSSYIREHNAKNIHLIKNTAGPGVLNAIKTGLEQCSEGAALVLMADTSDEIGIVDDMYARIEQGYDIVCGSRYMKGGRQIGGPVIKKAMTWTAGVSLHLLTGIATHDVSNRKSRLRARAALNWAWRYWSRPSGCDIALPNYRLHGRIAPPANPVFRSLNGCPAICTGTFMP
jgi:glycosyltransferase involved in cell wall biosynthesis